MSRRARLQVAPELLCQALDLPDDVRIMGATFTYGAHGGHVVDLLIEHASLPELNRGAIIPIVNAYYERVKVEGAPRIEWRTVFKRFG
jgi:hypothetical protein